MGEPSAIRVRLWDLPVRLCHWSFVILIPALWWTAENEKIGLHMRLGMLLLVLLTFRILWGFFGSSTARFASFVRGPRAVASYLSSLGNPAHAPAVGHNPAGGWSVLALLGTMAVQVALGLISGDPDDNGAGPLYDVAGYEIAYSATWWHTKVVFNVIVAAIALHIAAILFYRLVKRDNLIAPMVTGARAFPQGSAAMIPVPAWRVLVCVLAAIVLAGWIWSGIPPLG